ncbi:methionine ABC transporter permease [Alteribacter lacisalsi]|uniref:Methionine ABC transporter permease n=1 Tax=Alteribacter lacisalsi TaxID=2045244 RepID=A0A2W0H337_9BACI|nr:methionine ABC transporter permease [Alteribacter lacisalsi]PYZ95617.1 methionine ABC transporter permease [Alteribacter lacisalsi]
MRDTDWSTFWVRVWEATLETLAMTAFPLVFASLIGIPLGVAVVVTRKGQLFEHRVAFVILNTIVNMVRSVPFIILLVALIPLTRLIVGTTIGTTAAMVPLVIFAAPFIARLVESSLLEVDPGVTEAAKSMGATPWQIIFRFLIPEALSSLVLNLTIATVGLVGASAMAGAIGSGGLGDLAIAYGYQRFHTDVMIVTVILLIIIVQVIQAGGNHLSRAIRRR